MLIFKKQSMIAVPIIAILLMAVQLFLPTIATNAGEISPFSYLIGKAVEVFSNGGDISHVYSFAASGIFMLDTSEAIPIQDFVSSIIHIIFTLVSPLLIIVSVLYFERVMRDNSVAELCAYPILLSALSILPTAGRLTVFGIIQLVLTAALLAACLVGSIEQSKAQKYLTNNLEEFERKLEGIRAKRFLGDVITNTMQFNEYSSRLDETRKECANINKINRIYLKHKIVSGIASSLLISIYLVFSFSFQLAHHASLLILIIGAIDISIRLHFALGAPSSKYMHRFSVIAALLNLLAVYLEFVSGKELSSGIIALIILTVIYLMTTLTGAYMIAYDTEKYSISPYTHCDICNGYFDRKLKLGEGDPGILYDIGELIFRFIITLICSAIVMGGCMLGRYLLSCLSARGEILNQMTVAIGVCLILLIFYADKESGDNICDAFGEAPARIIASSIVAQIIILAVVAVAVFKSRHPVAATNPDEYEWTIYIMAIIATLIARFIVDLYMIYTEKCPECGYINTFSSKTLSTNTEKERRIEHVDGYYETYTTTTRGKYKGTSYTFDPAYSSLSSYEKDQDIEFEVEHKRWVEGYDKDLGLYEITKERRRRTCSICGHTIDYTNTYEEKIDD